jgi:hypothetical protein
MFELEARAAGGVFRQADREPADRSAELPGHRQQPRRLATLDLPARIPGELVAAAEAQITRDGQKPSRNPLGAGQGIPDILDARVTGARRNDGPRRPPFALAAADRAENGADLADNIELHRGLHDAQASPPRSRIEAYTYISRFLNRGKNRGSQTEDPTGSSPSASGQLILTMGERRSSVAEGRDESVSCNNRNNFRPSGRSPRLADIRGMESARRGCLVRGGNCGDRISLCGSVGLGVGTAHQTGPARMTSSAPERFRFPRIRERSAPDRA